MSDQRALSDPSHPSWRMRRGCELVGLNRATWHLEPSRQSPRNLQLMRVIDRRYSRTPFYGSLEMTAYLRIQDYAVNQKWVARFKRLMGLQAVQPRLRTSQPQRDR